MIAIGVEHAGIENFAKNQAMQTQPPEDMVIVHSWEELRKNLPAVRKALLGERLLRNVNRASVVKVMQSHAHVHWVLWLGEGSAWSDIHTPHVTVWSGDLTPERLEQWISEPLSKGFGTLPPRWMLWSVGGGGDRLGTVRLLGHHMQQLYGMGTWVDLDWDQGLLTRDWKEQGAGDENYPYARMQLQKAEWGWVVPAPPPWVPILFKPENREVEKVLRSARGGWQGWDIGTNLRGMNVGVLASELDTVIIHVSEDAASFKFIDFGMQALKSINPKLTFVTAGSGAGRAGKRFGVEILGGPEVRTSGLRKALWRFSRVPKV